MPSKKGHGPNTAVLYTSVSTDEQAKTGHSLSQQIEPSEVYDPRRLREVPINVRNWSVWLDLAMLARTAKSVVLSRGLSENDAGTSCAWEPLRTVTHRGTAG